MKGRPRKNDPDAIYYTELPIPVDYIFRVALTEDRGYMYFAVPSDGSEVLMVGSMYGTREQAHQFALHLAHRFKVQVVNSEAFTKTEEAPSFTFIAEGNFQSHDGRVLVQDFASGVWVRDIKRNTGRGPYGDAVRYEPTLHRALKWAESYVAGKVGQQALNVGQQALKAGV